MWEKNGQCEVIYHKSVFYQSSANTIPTGRSTYGTDTQPRRWAGTIPDSTCAPWHNPVDTLVCRQCNTPSCNKTHQSFITFQAQNNLLMQSHTNEPCVTPSSLPFRALMMTMTKTTMTTVIITASACEGNLGTRLGSCLWLDSEWETWTVTNV